MDQAVKDLIEISHRVGKDTSLILGSGGNTSVKTPDGKFIYIKASGTPLKQMSDHKGWRRMRTADVRDIAQMKQLSRMNLTAREHAVASHLLRACDDDQPPFVRPSIEAHFHAVLKSRYVIHLHPEIVGPYVNSKEGPRKIQRLFKNEKYPALYIPYANLGYESARKMNRSVQNYEKDHGRPPTVLFLEKHGVVVCQDSKAGVLRSLKKVIRLCKTALPEIPKRRVKQPENQQIRHAKLAIRGGVYHATGQYTTVSFQRDAIMDAFLGKANAKKLLTGRSLTPDEVAYTNGPPIWLDQCDVQSVAKSIEKRPAAATFVVRGLGLFSAGPSEKVDGLTGVARAGLLARLHADRWGGVVRLTAAQEQFVKDKEARAIAETEKMKNGDIKKPLQNRIAVVTGGGSGIGRGIVIGLARAGAKVAVFDVDSKGSAETVRQILQQLPHANVQAIRCNVTDEKSIQDAYEQVLHGWGGLDILVNAAGVAPAFALEELPADKWRFALEVNLTGYFLMAKHAARIMKQQAMGGSIVNISSKSGLEASKNNTPYNATKAGEIHMARGWAMELGEVGIRVNSLCPGNVFEGSRIWNPQYIKVCAKKYGIRPEEVIPYYVNRTILKKEIKRQDIADGVVFLCSDQARMITGQTLVVDAGQVMVR